MSDFVWISVPPFAWRHTEICRALIKVQDLEVNWTEELNEIGLRSNMHSNFKISDTVCKPQSRIICDVYVSSTLT